MNFPYDPLIRDVPDFPNYQISEDGVVYSKITGKEMTLRKENNGYLRLKLRKNGKENKLYLHRILAEVFIENTKNYDIVDHIDRNSLNNNLQNLRWVTHFENMQNCKVPTHNTSGIKGVTLLYRKNRDSFHYSTYIRAYNKVYKRQFPPTPEGLEQAKEWRKAKELELQFVKL